MLKIRNDVFETNSSSSHALVYSQKNPNRIEYKLETDNGVLTIHFRDYGWSGPESLTGFGTDDLLVTSNDKLDYVATTLCRQLNWGDEHDTTHKEAEQMIAAGLVYEELEDLLEKIKEKCQEVKEIKFELNAEEYGDPFGSIDHQSQDLLDDEDLMRVIFNKGCMIVIDNDNSDYYDAFNPTLKPGLNTGVQVYVGSNYTCSKYNITEKDFED